MRLQAREGKCPQTHDPARGSSLLTAFLSNADPGNRATRQQTLSEIYRNSGDIELQNKVAPFKVFDNLYHVGPGYVDAWLIPTSAGIIMIDTAEERSSIM